VRRLWQQPSHAQRMREAGLAVLKANQGALERLLGALERLLQSH
jgi:3-deoxy-D-manno-octulosonic-acid transferase